MRIKKKKPNRHRKPEPLIPRWIYSDKDGIWHRYKNRLTRKMMREMGYIAESDFFSDDDVFWLEEDIIDED